MLITKIISFKSEELGEVRAGIIKDDIWFCAKDLTDIMGVRGARFTSIPKEHKRKVLYSDLENPTELNFPLSGLLFVDRDGLQTVLRNHPKGKCKIKLRKFITGEIIPQMFKEQERVEREEIVREEQAEKEQELLDSLQLFENPDFGGVRAAVKDGEPFLFGKDVAASLGYKDVNKAIAMHVDKKDKISSNTLFDTKQKLNRKTRLSSGRWSSENTDTTEFFNVYGEKILDDKTSLKTGVYDTKNVDTADNSNGYADFNFGQRGGWFINESGVYSLILSSKLPKAKEFKRWITSEVLPSIRKNGGYIRGQETLSDAEILSRAIMVSQNILREREAKIAALEQENEKLLPAAQYCRDVLQSDELLTVTTIAKEFGYSAREFNEILKKLGIQYFQNGLWVLKKPYDDKGYTKIKTYVYSVNGDGTTKTSTQTYWTQAGRMFLHKVMEEMKDNVVM